MAAPEMGDCGLRIGDCGLEGDLARAGASSSLPYPLTPNP